MSANQSGSDCKSGFPKGTLALFAKTPVLGTVKTRMQPALSREESLQLHQFLVEHCLDNLCELFDTHGARIGSIQLWISDNPGHAYWTSLKARYRDRLPLEFRVQQGADLGDRLKNAFDEGLRQTEWMLIMGSDCPDLDSNYLSNAMHTLASGSNLVIGPALDGGYVLIGLTSPNSPLFSHIDWGTEKVLAQTLAKAKSQGITVNLLEPLRDMDIPDDLNYLPSVPKWRA